MTMQSRMLSSSTTKQSVMKIFFTQSRTRGHLAHGLLGTERRSRLHQAAALSSGPNSTCDRPGRSSKVWADTGRFPSVQHDQELVVSPSRPDRLPDDARAIARQAKIAGYLLSPSHRDGRGKARFFAGHGFSLDRWEEFASAMRRHAMDHTVAETVETVFGVRYVIEGVLPTPDGRAPRVRTVWFVREKGEAPTLVTAYPVKAARPKEAL